MTRMRTPAPWSAGGVRTVTTGPRSRLMSCGQHEGMRTRTDATWHVGAGERAARAERRPTKHANSNPCQAAMNPHFFNATVSISTNNYRFTTVYHITTVWPSWHG